MGKLYMLVQSCKFSVSYKGPFSIKKQKFKIDLFLLAVPQSLW